MRFQQTKQNISLHLNTIIKEGELDKRSGPGRCLEVGKTLKTHYGNMFLQKRIAKWSSGKYKK